MKTDLRPAYYALPRGAWRDYVTLLHPPYTLWHLSYVALGAAAAPDLRLDRLAGLALAFFLAVGIGAHALDEYRSRPLSTRIPGSYLLALAALSITGAVAIGLLATLSISLWAIPFVAFGTFMVLAYNLEVAGGRFHSDIWFGLAWGSFPALAGYWANAERLDATAFLVAAGCFALSMAQRVLSNRVRGLRREARTAHGSIEYRDGRVQAITMPYLLADSEAALRLMGASIALMATGWLLAGL